LSKNDPKIGSFFWPSKRFTFYFLRCQEWVAAELKTSIRTVQRHWSVSLEDIARESKKLGVVGPKRKLCAANLEFIEDLAQIPEIGCRQISKSLKRSHRVAVSFMTIYRELKRSGNLPWKQVKRTLLSELNIENRLEICEMWENCTEEDFLRLACSDEFFLWSIRKHNNQNFRVWAKNRQDVWDKLVAPQVQHPTCVGFFLCFTSKAMVWKIKEHGESWDGEYFRESILKQLVIPFLRNRRNAHGRVDETIFLHDMAGCMRANETHALLDDESINFLRYDGYGRYPGRSPVFNAAEHLGALAKFRADSILSEMRADGRNSRETLVRVLTDVLRSMENETELFRTLLKSYPKRVALVKAAGGRSVNYC